MSEADAPACGTYSGYQLHRKRDEKPCGPCREASAAYMRNYRSLKPERWRADRWWNSTRIAALERLAREYPDRFQAIITEERSAQLPDSPWRPPVDVEAS